MSAVSSVSSGSLVSAKLNFQNYYANVDLSKEKAYQCPSTKGLKFSVNDFKIIDAIQRHELTLPEINKKKVIKDPALIFHVEKQLPVQNDSKNTPMQCLQLNNERKWRARKMNIKKKRKYEKKLFYVNVKRRQNKEKRFNEILAMYEDIQKKKVELFDPTRFMHREIEKAKFFGFQCSPVYSEYRKIVDEKMKSFDEKLTRKFDNKKLPIHIKLNMDLSGYKGKRRKQVLKLK